MNNINDVCFVFVLAVGEWLLILPRHASLAHSRFRPTTEAYSQGKFLTNAAQHRSYPKSARYGRAAIQTHDPVVGYLVWHSAAILTAQVRTAPNGSDRPTAIVSKVGADAPVECKSSYKPQQPQPSSNTSLPLARDYSPCKGGQPIFRLLLKV